MKIRIFGVTVLAACLVIVGYALGKVVNVPGVTFDNKISAIHLINIITTVIIAVVIGLIIDAQRKKSVFKKELIVCRIDDPIKIVDFIYEIVGRDSIPWPHVTSLNKRFRMYVDCIIKVLEEGKIKASKLEADKMLPNIERLEFLMTSTPANLIEGEGASQPVFIKNGLVKYSTGRVSEIYTQVEILKIALFKLQMKINDELDS